jgi:hypothetical protein
MKKFIWSLMIMLFLGGLLVQPAQAEDADVVGICTDPASVNYVGVEVITSIKDAGLTVVNEGCYYLQCDEVLFEDGTGTGAYSCEEITESTGNYWSWVNNTLLPQPALSQVEGCLDPSAENYMNPIFWTGYEITEANWTCTYPEPELIPVSEIRKDI